MASLIKHETGIFVAQFYEQDRRPSRKRVSLKTRNRRTAERVLAKLDSDYLLGTYDPWGKPEAEAQPELPPKLRTVGEAVDAYMASCSHLSRHTIRTYQSIFNLFRESVGASREVARVTPNDVIGFLNSTRANPVTRHKYVKHLGYLFRYLVRMGVLDSDLSKKVKLPRLPEQAPKSLTASDINSLVQTIEFHSERSSEDNRTTDYRWLVQIVKANVYLGLRLGEVIHLRWDHVDLQARLLAVRNTDEFTAKRGKERVLPIPDQAFEVLQSLWEGRGELPYVFTSHMGRLKLHYLSQAFLWFRRRAGLPGGLTFHSTRHTYATWLAERGVPVGVIKELMGHSSITTTERYMKMRPTTTQHWVHQAFASGASTA